MAISLSFRLIVAAGALGLALQANADSFVSSASSAGSASSGSISDSLNGSSNSSKGDRKVADGEYRIIQIAQTPDRVGRTRVTMQADDPEQRIVLDLPQQTFQQQGLVNGDAHVRAEPRLRHRVRTRRYASAVLPGAGRRVVRRARFASGQAFEQAGPRAGAGLAGLRGAVRRRLGKLASSSGGSLESRFCDRSTADDRRPSKTGCCALPPRCARSWPAWTTALALVSRSGLDLSRFRHPLFACRAGVAFRSWRSGPRASFTMPATNTAPENIRSGPGRFRDRHRRSRAGLSVHRALACRFGHRALCARPCSTTRRVLHLLAATYSANAYAFSTRYQNCNQWVMEMLAAGWGDLPDGEDLRERAQALAASDAHYAPQPVDVDSRLLMLASLFRAAAASGRSSR
jgi:hypothetical protein